MFHRQAAARGVWGRCPAFQQPPHKLRHPHDTICATKRSLSTAQALRRQKRVTPLTEKPHGLFISNMVSFNSQPPANSLKCSTTDSEPFAPQARDPIVQELALCIHKNDLAGAWDLFSSLSHHQSSYSSLAQLNALEWTRFLELFPAGFHESWSSWPRIKHIVATMRALSLDLSPRVYGVLIGQAFRVGQHTEVENIWLEAQQRHGLDGQTLLDVDTWNKYILATCNCDARCWYDNNRKIPSRSYNDATVLLEEMQRIGLSPNCRTYELLILYFAHEGRSIDRVESVVNLIWGTDPDHPQLPIDSVLYPRITTLKAIIDAYAVNDRFLEGLALMETLRSCYSINLSNPSSMDLWKSLLSWCFFTSGPRGSTPAATFDNLWALMTEKYGIRPQKYLWLLRLKQLKANNRVADMLNTIPRLVAQKQHLGLTVAESYFIQTLKLLLRTKANPVIMRNLLNQWGPIFPGAAERYSSIVSEHEAESSSGRIGSELNEEPTTDNGPETIKTCLA